MSRAERLVTRALKITPQEDRPRYEAEWRGDLAAADRLGLRDGDVGRAALALAWRLRLRRIGRVLTGQRGAGRMLGTWCGLGLLAVVAFLLAGPFLVFFLLCFAVIGIALARAGSPSHWSHWLMVVATVMGAISAGYIWWAFGVNFDAADTGKPAPPLAAWEGTAFLVLLASIIAFLVAVTIAVIRESRRTRGR